MDRGLLLCVLLLTLTPPSPVEAWEPGLDTGAVLGPRYGQRTTGAGWLTVLAPPFHGGFMEVELPGSSGILSWDSSRSEWGWLGWTLVGEGSTTRILSVGAQPGRWTARWDGYPFSARFSGPWLLAADHGTNDFELGGAALGMDGAIEASIPLSQGVFQGKAQTFWGGVPTALVFFGNLSFDTKVARNLLIGGFSGVGNLDSHFGGVLLRNAPPDSGQIWSWSLVGLSGMADVGLDARKSLALEGEWTTQGNSRGLYGAVWADQQWRFGDWTFGLGSGFGLLSVNNPAWSQRRTWTEAVFYWPWPIPSWETRSTKREYSFTTDPAWGLLIHPAVSWRPLRECELTLSRWVPLTGGWAYGDSSEPAQSVSSGADQAGRPTPQGWEDLLWAGTQLSVKLAW